MLQPHERSFRSLSAHGFHRVVYRDWGHPESARVLVCAHGLTRNGRDFDALAAALADRFRVLCPDMPGRGDSQWLANPGAYAFTTYLTALTRMLAHSGVEHVSRAATSMRGRRGTISALQPARAR